jgi:hypothetical protein
MAIKITITAGVNIGDPLYLSTSPDNITWTPYEVDYALGAIPKADLVAGYIITSPPYGTAYYKVEDLTGCNVEPVILHCDAITTTSTSTTSTTSSSTTTSTSSTTSTTSTTSSTTTTSTTTIAPTTTTTTTGSPTTTTTTTMAVWEYTLGFGVSKIAACADYSGSPLIVYSVTSSFVSGMSLYLDSGLTSPVEGYTHVVNGSDAFFMGGYIVGSSDGPCA